MNFSVFVSNMSPQHKDASICHHVMGQVEPCEHFKAPVQAVEALEKSLDVEIAAREQRQVNIEQAWILLLEDPGISLKEGNMVQRCSKKLLLEELAWETKLW